MFDFLNPESNLIKGLNKYTNNFITNAPKGINQNERWLATSSLQKSIRRGMFEDAMYAAHILKLFNPLHLWKRLAVISLEDIGLANIDLVAQVLWVAGKAQWRSKHHGEDYILSYIIYHLCSSKKSRVLDDSLYIAEYHPLYNDQRMLYSCTKEDKLCRLFNDHNLDVIEKVLLCRYLVGNRYRSDVLKLQKGNPKVIFELAHSIGTPQHVIDLLSLSKQQEYYTCLLPCVEHMERSDTCNVIDDVLLLPRMVGAYPDFAYDRHTRNGKVAFRSFLKKSPDITNFIVTHCSQANPVNLVGWAVFILESQSLNNRLIYDGSEHLRKLVAQSWLYSGGMPIEVQNEFLNLMKDNYESLYDARQSTIR